MLTFNKILIVTLLATFAACIQAEDEGAMLTQLQFKDSNSTGGEISYKCTVGTFRSDHIACYAQDKTSFPEQHDVKLTLRCPKSGSRQPISYVQIIFTITSNLVNCRVTEGGIGQGLIGMELSAARTKVFNYDAKFYGY